MIPTVTVEAMLRLLQASPEQGAALAVFMETVGTGNGGQHGGEVRLVWGEGAEAKRKAEISGSGNEEEQNFEHSTSNLEPRRGVSEEVARSAFALLVRLDAEGRFKAPSPLTVFRLYCVDGHSADLVARKCRCAKGTVMARLRFIEEQTKTRAEDFRAMSGHLQQMDDELRASGAREIYRQGLAGRAVSDGDEEE